MKDQYLFDEPLEIGFKYDVTFGKGDGSETCEWSVTATPEEERSMYEAYTEDVDKDDLITKYPVLNDAYNRAYAEIEEQETQNALDMGIGYAEECTENGSSPFRDGWSLHVDFCSYEDCISMENALKYADKYDKHYFFNEHCDEIYEFTDEVPVDYFFTVDNPWYETDPETTWIQFTAEEVELYKYGMEQGLAIDEIEGLHNLLRRARHQIFCDAEFDPEEQPNVTMKISFPKNYFFDDDDTDELEENLNYLKERVIRVTENFKAEDYMYGKPFWINFYYTVTFGSLDGSEKIDWILQATPEEEKAIYDAYTEDLFDDDDLIEAYPVLKEAYDRAYSQIEEEEIDNGYSMDIEYVKECIKERTSPFDAGWDLNVHFSPFDEYISIEDALKYADKYNKHNFFAENCEKGLNLTEEVSINYCFSVQNPWYATDMETIDISVTAEEAQLYNQGLEQELALEEVDGLQNMLKRARHQIFCNADFDPEEQPNVTLEMSFPEIDIDFDDEEA